MALDSYHSSFLCESHKLVLESLIARCHNEAYVHYRTVFLGCCTYEIRVAVDLCVKHSRLLLVDLLDSLESAHFLNPLQCLVHNEDREHRRSVEHRLSVDMSAVVEHCRDITAHLSESVLLHDSESHTCRTDILLGTTVDECILAYVYRTAHNVR